MGCCCCNYAYNPAYTQAPSSAAGGGDTPQETAGQQLPQNQAAYGSQVQSGNGTIATDAQIAAGDVRENLQDVAVNTSGAPAPVDTAATDTDTTTDTTTDTDSTPTSTSTTAPAPIDTAARDDAAPVADAPPRTGDGSAPDGSEDGGVYNEPVDATGGGEPGTPTGPVRTMHLDWAGLTRPTGSFDPGIDGIVYRGVDAERTKALREAGAPEELIAYAAASKLKPAEVDQLIGLVRDAVARGETIVVANPEPGASNPSPSANEPDGPITRDPVWRDRDARIERQMAGGTDGPEVGARPETGFTPEWEQRFTDLVGDDPAGPEFIAEVRRTATSEKDLVAAYESAYRQLGGQSQWNNEWQARFDSILGTSAEAREQIASIRASALSRVAIEYTFNEVQRQVAEARGAAFEPGPEWAEKFRGITIDDPETGQPRPITEEEIASILANVGSEEELAGIYAFYTREGEPVWSKEWEERFSSLKEVDPKTGELVPMTEESLDELRTTNVGEVDLGITYDRLAAMADEWAQMSPAEREQAARAMRMQSGEASIMDQARVFAPMAVPAVAVLVAGLGATSVGIRAAKRVTAANLSLTASRAVRKLSDANVRTILNGATGGRIIPGLQQPAMLTKLRGATTEQLAWLAHKSGIDVQKPVNMNMASASAPALAIKSRKELLEALEKGGKLRMDMLQRLPGRKEAAVDLFKSLATTSTKKTMSIGNYVIDVGKFEAAETARRRIGLFSDTKARFRSLKAAGNLRPVGQVLEQAAKNGVPKWKAALTTGLRAEMRTAFGVTGTTGWGRGIGRTFASGLKGAGLAFAAADLAMSAPGVVNTWKVEGSHAGSRAAGSAVGQAVGRAGGFMVGAKAGAAAGAALLAATGIGAAAAPVGAVVGGFVGGMIGSGLAGKALGWVGDKVGGFVHGLFGGKDDAKAGAAAVQSAPSG